MKLLILLLLVPALSFAQKDTVIKYTAVVAVDSASKEQLYQRARSWFNDIFKSSKDVIQIQDKETGEISGKGVLVSTIGFRSMGLRYYPAYYNFTCKVLVKDGRYKYEIGDFDNYQLNDASKGVGLLTSSTTSPKNYTLMSQKKLDEVWQSAKDKVDEKVQSMITSLKQAMSSRKVEDF